MTKEEMEQVGQTRPLEERSAALRATLHVLAEQPAEEKLARLGLALAVTALRESAGRAEVAARALQRAEQEWGELRVQEAKAAEAVHLIAARTVARESLESYLAKAEGREA